MPRLTHKLTETVVSKLKAPDPSGKQRLYWCSDLKGFGVLVSGATNTKTYVVQREVGGRTRRITIGPANVLTVAEARRQAERVLADLIRGIDPKAGKRGALTLRGALNAYIAGRPGLRPKSVAHYRASIEQYLTSWLDRPLRDIEPEMIEARHREIAAEVAGAGRFSGAATANGAMRAFRVLWNFAADREPSLPANPVARLKKQWFPVPRRERVLRADELSVFHTAVMALPNPVHRDYLLFLLFTGLRRREAAGLRWADVDLSEKLIRIPATRTKAGRKLDLPMSDVVFDMLVARRSLGNARYVFPSSSASGHVEEPRFALRQITVATGIHVSPHDLRRTFITIAESTDISPLALKALVNHSLGSDVTSGYVIMNVERLREPAQRVADRIKALCGISAPEGTVALRRSTP